MSMKLHDLFSIFESPSEHEFFGTLIDLGVVSVVSDARQAVTGSVFVAIPGTKVDGHSFIPQAIAQGVVALVVQNRDAVPADFKGFVLQVKNSRAALDRLASRFYGDPGNELFCIGVTGTNGKTSVTYMIEAILNSAGMPTGVIGTVNHHLLDQVWPSDMTTPDPVFLQKRLREFISAGAKAVAMEISSHALDQNRVDSVPFDSVAYTNLTRDHLDYHLTMDNYFEAKQKLFTDLLWKTSKTPCSAVVNIDDSYGRRLKVADPAQLITYGTADSDLRYKILKMGFASTEFEVKTPEDKAVITLPMAGKHNIMNALAAIGVGLSAGVSLEQCAKALSEFNGVPGRLQSVRHSKKVSVFVDYAHSPDALENVLTALQKVRASLNSSAKIWTVFGCGGDRDKGKRPLMAEMAVKYSDHVIVTSDNPRTENPQSIINDILKGVKDTKNVQVMVDRKEAIAQALREAGDDDVVLIAGKGHEDYQIIGTTKFPFSDMQVAQEILGGRS